MPRTAIIRLISRYTQISTHALLPECSPVTGMRIRAKKVHKEYACSVSTICDKKNDCDKGEDEANCPKSPLIAKTNTCPIGQRSCDLLDPQRCVLRVYICQNAVENRCINESAFCDGKIDCPRDGFDEQNCAHNSLSLLPPHIISQAQNQQSLIASASACQMTSRGAITRSTSATASNSVITARTSLVVWVSKRIALFTAESCHYSACIKALLRERHVQL